MTTYQPPSEDLSIFNSSVFTTANDASLTLSEAQSLFLGRTGTPTSTATSTTFSGGDIYIQGVRAGLGGGNSTLNLAFGVGALQNNTSGTQNVAIGTNALKTNTLGFYNTAVGNGALQYNGAVSSSGFENVAVGNLSLNTNTTGIENVAVGAEALYANSSGSYNCGFGYKSGYKTITGGFNTSIGWLSGYANTTGSNNVSIGGSTTVPVGTTTFSNTTALGVNTVIGASSSTAIGYGATTSVANSIVLGTATETVYCVGTSATNGSLIASADIFVNGIVRAGVGKFKSGTDADVNTAFGRNALIATTSATNSCGVGNGALAQLTSGEGNTGVGSLAGNAILAGIRNTALGSSCLKTLTSGNRNTALGNAAGQVIATGSENTVCGYNSGGSISGGSSNTFVGSTVSSGASVSSSSALGAFSGVGSFSNSTAIGGGTSAAIPGAICTAANQIMLGRTSETVECPGTVSSISLKTARNISINGTVFGIGAADSNALFCGLTDGTGTGAYNTLYGSGSYANYSDGSSFRNTIVGSLTMTNTNSSYSDSVVVGYGCENTGTLANTANKITLLGATTSAAANESTAIGYGATATLANQIMVGTSTEFVECAGTDGTNGCLKLNGGLKLQTAYGAVPSSAMLGYRVVTTGTAVVLTSTTISNLVNVSVPVGVWNVSFSVSVTVTSGGNVTAQNIVFSATTASTTALSTICGQSKSHSSDTYATNDVYIVSNKFEYQTTSATNIYLNMVSTFSGAAALTATGYVSLTRIG